MVLYSIGVNHEADRYRKSKTAPISMTLDTTFKTLLPAIFSALHNQTCWCLHSFFLPSQKHYLYSVCKNALHKTPENTDKFKLCSLQRKQHEHGSIWRGEWFVAKKCHFWSPFLGSNGGFRVGKYRLKAQGFKQLQKSACRNPVLDFWTTKVVGILLGQQIPADGFGLCIFSIGSWFIEFCESLAPFYWENFVQKRLVHQGNLLNFPTCSGSLREIKNHHSSHSGRIPWLDDGRYLIQNSFCWGWRPFRRKCSKSSIHVHPPYHSWPAGS